MSRVPASVVREVQRRCGGYCEAGGGRVSGKGDLHHRVTRGSGGKGNLDVTANLIFVCMRCHFLIHANPTLSYGHGFLVHTGEDPADREVIMIVGRCSD